MVLTTAKKPSYLLPHVACLALLMACGPSSKSQVFSIIKDSDQAILAAWNSGGPSLSAEAAKAQVEWSGRLEGLKSDPRAPQQLAKAAMDWYDVNQKIELNRADPKWDPKATPQEIVAHRKAAAACQAAIEKLRKIALSQ